MSDEERVYTVHKTIDGLVDPAEGLPACPAASAPRLPKGSLHTGLSCLFYWLRAGEKLPAPMTRLEESRLERRRKHQRFMSRAYRSWPFTR